jgi:hypothetical protein
VSRRRIAPALCALVLVACGGRAEKRVQGADELLAPYVPGVLGARLADVRAAHPGLEPLGPGAWIDAASPETLTVDVAGDAVIGVHVAYHEERADAVEHELRRRLGPGKECSPLPPEVQGFRSTLWRLPDGSGVSLQRMLEHVKLHVWRPAGDAFAQAYGSCP